MRKAVLSLSLFAVPGAQSKPHPLNLDDGLKRKLQTALKPGRHLKIHNGIHLDKNNLIVYESRVGRLGPENGEEACENQDFDEFECLTVGCCEWDEDQCWSNVGTAQCYDYYHDDGNHYTDDADDGDEHHDDHHDDHHDYYHENGEEACENQDFNEFECLNVGCCQWDEDRCWSDVGTGQCYNNYYYQDDGGIYFDDNTDDDFFEFFSSLSPMCTVSYLILQEDLDSQPFLEPDLVLSGDAIGYAFDFGADKDAIDAYTSYCTEIGGQNTMMEVDYSDSCMSPDFLNFPQCVGSSCDEGDLMNIGLFVTGNPSLLDCTVSTEVKSLDGTSDLGISASDVCIEDMVVIFITDNVYEYFDENLDDETGELGDIEGFGEICESSGGRVVLGTAVNNDGCVEDVCLEFSFSSLPLCIAKTCGNDEAIIFLQIMFRGLDATITLEEVDSDTDPETPSKSTKSSKKGGKAAKTAKSTKAAKTAKSKKAPKTEKATKTGKGK